MLRSKRKCVLFSKEHVCVCVCARAFLLTGVTYKAHENNGIKCLPFLMLQTFIKVAINVITTLFPEK